MSLQNDIQQLDDNIVGWDKRNLNDLKNRLNQLGVKHLRRSPNKIALQKALKSKLRKRAGLTDRISYKMPRSAIFLAKGVSKGHPISNPREAKDWYNSVVDTNIEKLADIVAEGSGNIVINNLNIK